MMGAIDTAVYLAIILIVMLRMRPTGEACLQHAECGASGSPAGSEITCTAHAWSTEPFGGAKPPTPSNITQQITLSPHHLTHLLR